MKTSTLIVVVSSVASLLLLAVPKKGSGTSGTPEAPFVPKISGAHSAEGPAQSERLTAQLLRLPTLEWVRDPFAPIEPPPETNPIDQEPDEPTPVEIPVEVPVEPEPEPEEQLPEPRSGPLPVLTGISQSGAHRFAIIDRFIAREGDLLASGDVVMSIGHRTVTLRKDDEIVVIRLGDGQ